jgi:hypothetical protein
MLVRLPRLQSLHFRACYYSQKPHFGLTYARNMSDSPQIGHTRPKPDSDGPSSEPLEKKPKLDLSSGTKKLSKRETARQKRKNPKNVLPEPYSSEDVLWRDVVSLLGKDVVDETLEAGTEWDSPFEFKQEVEVEVSCLSSSGMSLILYCFHRPVCPTKTTPCSVHSSNVRLKSIAHICAMSICEYVEIFVFLGWCHGQPCPLVILRVPLRSHLSSCTYVLTPLNFTYSIST